MNIKGSVHDYKGAAIPGATVTLWCDGAIVNIPENPQLSDSSGNYEFRNVEWKEYTVIANKDGKTASITYSGLGSTDVFIVGYDQAGGRAPTYEATIAPTRTPTYTVTVKPTATPTTFVEYYDRYYTWTYKGSKWTHTSSISKSLYEYYKEQPHNLQSDFAQYALSDYDRKTITAIVDSFESAGAKSGYSEYDNVMNVVCFVQSLPYTSDKVTTGYDEYPRYPIETLVDNGGDCEDTAILTAALLNEMGFGVVLVNLPGHMAVGVKCTNDYPGSYYEYNGARYYYLETTGDNWEIGQIPEEYTNSKATILPMIQKPEIDISFTSNLTSYDSAYAYYRVHCVVKNLGPGTAKNVTAYIAALALSRGENRVWVPDSTISLGDYPEGSSGWAEATVKIPRNENTQIECMVYGDNFYSTTVKSSTFNT
jgi:predicted transglutaminase-like cysteine proteinase